MAETDEKKPLTDRDGDPVVREEDPGRGRPRKDRTMMPTEPDLHHGTDKLKPTRRKKVQPVPVDDDSDMKAWEKEKRSSVRRAVRDFADALDGFADFLEGRLL